MKIRPFNTERMRKHRIKHLPHYKVYYVSREAIMGLPGRVIDEILAEMVRVFDYEMRRRHIWTKRKFRLQTYVEHEIDFDRERFIVEERFV